MTYVEVKLKFISRLLGPQAARVHAIVNEMDPTSQNVKIRLRGIGSGFYEGENRDELPEPLHFVVSTNDPAMLRPVCDRVFQLVNSVRDEMR